MSRTRCGVCGTTWARRSRGRWILAWTLAPAQGRPGRGRGLRCCPEQELMYRRVDLGPRRVAPWPGAVLALLREAEAAHAPLPRPGWVGRRVAMPPARP